MEENPVVHVSYVGGSEQLKLATCWNENLTYHWKRAPVVSRQCKTLYLREHWIRSKNFRLYAAAEVMCVSDGGKDVDERG